MMEDASLRSLRLITYDRPAMAGPHLIILGGRWLTARLAEFTRCHPQFWPITASVLMWVLPHRWISRCNPDAY
jgi:hypothetical protein